METGARTIEDQKSWIPQRFGPQSCDHDGAPLLVIWDSVSRSVFHEAKDDVLCYDKMLIAAILGEGAFLKKNKDMYTYMYVNTQFYTYRIYIYIYTCVCIIMYVYIYTYLNLNIHLYINMSMRS